VSKILCEARPSFAIFALIVSVTLVLSLSVPGQTPFNQASSQLEGPRF
jgi:hypothetical protein